MQNTIKLKNFEISNDKPLTIISGPCQLEGLDHSLIIAEKLAKACDKFGANFIFKGSFDKANRTSLSGKRGLGIQEGLRIMQEINSELGCPTVTDIHTAEQCAITAQVVDVLQIPAFLCRQTDLLLAAANTGAILNIKKGQFLAPWDMHKVLEKASSTGNQNIMACERGTSFGYNTLVADMRGLPEMGRNGVPVIMDATHSVQQPGGNGGSSGGQREFAPVMARCAVSLGIAGVFIESHEDPDNAPSDGQNMIQLERMPELIKSLMAFDKLAKETPIRL
ncbi:MAG: 3-deoxy-8-phosphooctulonate synthase [Amylibacter sp.]|jgi:2-dehydro-3-deoxyphosphooctonate aldolase (KDO 8-P synthase)|tara:strand:- start:7166 stop:8002 length:837 start_codon:yes stop_codon:yes gene_type:complete